MDRIQNLDKLTRSELADKISEILGELGLPPNKKLKFFQYINARVGMQAIKHGNATLAMNCAATVILAQDQIDLIATSPADNGTTLPPESDRR